MSWSLSLLTIHKIWSICLVHEKYFISITTKVRSSSYAFTQHYKSNKVTYVIFNIQLSSCLELHMAAFSLFRIFAFPFAKIIFAKNFCAKTQKWKTRFLYQNCQKWTKNWWKVSKNVKQFSFSLFFSQNLPIF